MVPLAHNCSHTLIKQCEQCCRQHMGKYVVNAFGHILDSHDSCLCSPLILVSDALI